MVKGLVGSFLGVVAGDDCVDYLNSYRASVGKPPLAGSFDTGCEQDDAVFDCVNGWHKSFGNCGEGGQCEAVCQSCHDAVDMFYNEGPGGGHYDIMMSDSYAYVFWGQSLGCYSGQNFFTFNFYWPSIGSSHDASNFTATSVVSVSSANVSTAEDSHDLVDEVSESPPEVENDHIVKVADSPYRRRTVSTTTFPTPAPLTDGTVSASDRCPPGFTDITDESECLAAVSANSLECWCHTRSCSMTDRRRRTSPTAGDCQATDKNLGLGCLWGFRKAQLVGEDLAFVSFNSSGTVQLHSDGGEVAEKYLRFCVPVEDYGSVTV